MKKRIFTIAVILVIVTLSIFAYSSYAEQVTEISTEKQLSEIVSNSSYKLTSDINITSENFSIETFGGILDGNGHKITGLSQPLFTALTGTVENLTLEGIISTSASEAGSLAVNANGATVRNVTSYVTITAELQQTISYYGGIVGVAENNTLISNSFFRGNLTVNGYNTSGDTNGFGGISGKIDNSIITGCENYAPIKSVTETEQSNFKGAIAGIVGHAFGTLNKITECRNIGTVEACKSKLNVAGIIGRYMNSGASTTNIISCINNGNLTGTEMTGESLGGIAGYVRQGMIQYCLNTGTISSNQNDGGIVGYYNASTTPVNISYNYNIGEVGEYQIGRINNTPGKLTATSNFIIGDIVASNASDDVTGAISCTDKEELCTALMALEDTKYVSDSLNINNGYPLLDWQVNGKTEAVNENLIVVNGVYEIKNAGQLTALANKINSGEIPSDASVKLIDNINAASALPTISLYNGTFDGNGKTISEIDKTPFIQFDGVMKNITIQGKIENSVSNNASGIANASNGGKFSGVISEVNLEVAANDLNIGGIVGYAKENCVFENCTYSGSISARWNGDNGGVGGIVGCGSANSEMTITDCVFTGSINIVGGYEGKAIRVGGIIGYIQASNHTTVSRSICNGTLKSEITAGNDRVGGIIGEYDAAGTVTLNYCTNKSDIVSVKTAGGIIGNNTDISKAVGCCNYGVMTALQTGSIIGANSSFVLLEDCVNMNAVAQALCGDGGYENKNSCNYGEIIAYEKDLTIGNSKYDSYNFGFINKTNDIMAPSMKTDSKFEAYISIRENPEDFDTRFVLLANLAKLTDVSSAEVKITFKKNGQNVKTYEGIFGGADSDFIAYRSVTAADEVYFASGSSVLFGVVIKSIPYEAWDTATLSICDPSDESIKYLENVEYVTDEEEPTLESLPDYSSIGSVAQTIYNCGPGIELDRTAVTDSDSRMVVIKATSKGTFTAYLDTLKNNGYTQVYSSTLESNEFYTFQKRNKQFYIYYNEQGRVRIIEENSGNSLKEFNYTYSKEAGDTTELYQYSLNHTNSDVIYTESDSINCGMLYIIKLADNKLVVIDGGHNAQSTTKSRRGIYDFMCSITGDTKPTIAAWYFTHAHGDHVRLAADFMEEYSTRVNVERIMYNFPSYQVVGSGYDSNTFTLKENIAKYFGNALFLKMHTGQKITLGDITIDVLLTHEDLVNDNGVIDNGNNFNNTSTVIKVTFDDKTITFLADTDTKAQTAIFKYLSANTLKSDVVQVSHHGFNSIGTFYTAISARIALVPNSRKNAAGSNHDKYLLYSVFATDGVYFADSYTYKLTVSNGSIVVTEIPRYDA